MRLVKSLLLYTAMCLVANSPAFAADTAALEALRDGDMKKLSFHSEPKRVSDLEFSGPDGAMRLTDFDDQIVLVNFWATWCAPCRKEMPMLSELQTELGGDKFQVVTLATGRNSPEGIAKFFGEIEVDNLPHYMDHRQAIARDMGVLGLPVTLILNRDGQEIARLMGDADWASDSAKQILQTLIDEPAS